MIPKKSDLPLYSANPFTAETDWLNGNWPYSEAAQYLYAGETREEENSLLLPVPETPRNEVNLLPQIKTTPVYELCLVDNLRVEIPKKKSTAWKMIQSLVLAFVVGILSAILIAQHSASKLVKTISNNTIAYSQLKLRQDIVSKLDGETLAAYLSTHKLDSPLGQMLLTEATQRKDERLSKVLAALTDSSERKTRVTAMRALSTPFHLAQKSSIRALLDRMQWDKDLIVRSYAAKTIARSGNEAALDSLREQLLRERSSFVAAILIREIEKAQQSQDLLGK